MLFVFLDFAPSSGLDDSNVFPCSEDGEETNMSSKLVGGKNRSNLLISYGNLRDL